MSIVERGILIDQQKLKRIGIKTAAFLVVFIAMNIVAARMNHKPVELRILADIIGAVFCAVVTEFIPPIGRKRQ